MLKIGRIYIYKFDAYMRVKMDGEISYFTKTADWSGCWQKCKKELWSAAKYYGKPAKNNLLPRDGGNIKRKREMQEGRVAEDETV
ncbi:MAG: hypothetical protein IPM96_16060 [Ignavibacteria bacterium]|nr:hypothetical protein [Ignavibacteria bacterium]